MAKHLNFFTDFEYKGTWWIPNNPDVKLHGSIKFIHSNYILLELMDLFEKKASIQLLKPEIILGITDDGEKVTLFQSYETEFCGPPFDFEYKTDIRIGKQNFICRYMFIGKHFDREKDIMFKYLFANFTYLDQWIDNSFKVKETKNSYVIKTTPIESKLKIDSMNTTLTILSNPAPIYKMFSAYGGGTDRFNIKYNSCIRINPDEPMNFKWFEDFVTNLGNLLTLFIGYPVYPTRLHGEALGAADDEIVNIYYVIENPKYVEGFRFIYMDNRYPELIKYTKSERMIAEVINNWFEKLELLGPVYDLISIAFYDSSMYPRTYFLTLMQGIETFHRRVIGGGYLDKEDYKPILKDLSKSIPNDLSAELKRSIKIRLKYAYEFTLQTRLDDLKNRGIGEFNYFKPIMGDVPDIIGKLVNTRNYHNHFDKKDDQVIFSDDELPEINKKLLLF